MFPEFGEYAIQAAAGAGQAPAVIPLARSGSSSAFYAVLRGAGLTPPPACRRSGDLNAGGLERATGRAARSRLERAGAAGRARHTYTSSPAAGRKVERVTFSLARTAARATRHSTLASHRVGPVC